ncbi:MAG: hypothetical protein J5633_10385 [Oscillospiraceae bacterium]|nr:hypothetical protein [Oscillospiraceae bacterium]
MKKQKIFSAGGFGCQPLLCGYAELVLLHVSEDTQIALYAANIVVADEGQKSFDAKKKTDNIKKTYDQFNDHDFQLSSTCWKIHIR